MLTVGGEKDFSGGRSRNWPFSTQLLSGTTRGVKEPCGCEYLAGLARHSARLARQGAGRVTADCGSIDQGGHTYLQTRGHTRDTVLYTAELSPAPEIRETSRIREFSGNSTENSTEFLCYFKTDSLA